MINRLNDDELATKTYKEFGELFAASDDADLSAYGRQIESSTPPPSLVGKPFPLEGPTLDGQRFSIDKYKGKVVLVDFWATWCGPCKAKLPGLAKLYEQYHDKGFEIIGVDLDKNLDDLGKFLDDNKLPWINIVGEKDDDGMKFPLAEKYGIDAIPTTFLVGRDARVALRDPDDDELAKKIEELLKPNPSPLAPLPQGARGNRSTAAQSAQHHTTSGKEARKSALEISPEKLERQLMTDHRILRAGPIVIVAALVCAFCCGSLRAADNGTTINADEALHLLLAGNERFAAGKPEHPHTDLSRVESTAKNGQAPFAAVLSCADSRVPVETVFDRGVGDLFVVRVAGNVADSGTLASVEYAAEHLHTPLVVVMGHTQCGAVKAAVDNAQLDGSLPALIDLIRPAVSEVRKRNPGAGEQELFIDSIKQNVRQQIGDSVEKSPILRRMVREGKVKIVGALQDRNRPSRMARRHRRHDEALKTHSTSPLAPAGGEGPGVRGRAHSGLDRHLFPEILQTLPPAGGF